MHGWRRNLGCAAFCAYMGKADATKVALDRDAAEAEGADAEPAADLGQAPGGAALAGGPAGDF